MSTVGTAWLHIPLSAMEVVTGSRLRPLKLQGEVEEPCVKQTRALLNFNLIIFLYILGYILKGGETQLSKLHILTTFDKKKFFNSSDVKNIL